jgi:hypothetical protein
MCSMDTGRHVLSTLVHLTHAYGAPHFSRQVETLGNQKSEQNTIINNFAAAALYRRPSRSMGNQFMSVTNHMNGPESHAVECRKIIYCLALM